MTINIDNTTASVWVAIDIAKRRHDVLIKHADGRTQSFKVANTAEDFSKFLSHLASLPKPCQIAFEPTADYRRAIAWRLVRAGLDVRLVSSVACARAREAIFNSRDKNDPKRNSSSSIVSCTASYGMRDSC
jgi:transposase